MAYHASEKLLPYNNGQPNAENPKIASRHFLSAIDRVDHLAEKKEKELQRIREDLPKIRAIMKKPFEKETELQLMKTELTGLEAQIGKTKQEKQTAEIAAVPDLEADIKEAI